MAADSNNFVLAAAIVLTIILACASPSSCQADLIESVCMQLVNETYCLEFLRSDPRSNMKQTYELLAEISIDKGLNQSSKVAAVARKLKNQWNAVLTEGCAVSMDAAGRSLNEAKYLLKTMKKDKSRQSALETMVLDSMAFSIECDRKFNYTYVHEPLILKRNNAVFLQVNYVIAIVVSNLNFHEL